MRVKILLFLVLIATFLTGSVEYDVSRISAVPGEEVSFNLEITNEEDLGRNIQFSYFSPEGLSGKFIYSGKEVGGLRFEADESKNIQFQLKIPPNAEEKEFIVFVHAENRLAFRIDVKTPNNPLEIKPSITGAAMEGGKDVEFPLKIKNTLNAGYKVDLSCLVPKSWSYKFIENDEEVYQILLNQNEERSLKLRVESVSDAKVKEYPITAYFNKQTIKMNVEITKTHEGEYGKIKFKNKDIEGKVIDSARINVIGWREFSSSSEGEAIIEAPPGEYKINITKEGYYSKEIDNIEVKPGKINNLGTVTLDRRPFYAEVSVPNPKISCNIGSENTKFELKLENKGYKGDSYTLDVKGLPENFHSKFMDSQISTKTISEVFVESGKSKDIYLEILTPPSAEVGKHNLTLMIDGHYSIEKNITLNLKGKHKIDLEPVSGGYLIVTEPGEKARFDIKLRNAGKGVALTNINISTDAPSNWWIDVYPTKIPALREGKDETVKINTYIPEGAVPSEYKLKITVESDQATMNEELRIIVKEKGYTTVIGGIIIIIALAGVFIAFKKFGRR